MQQNQIIIQNLTKSFDGRRPLFKKVNITIEGGDFVFITGKSGSGKSTLLKLIHHIEKPDSGKIIIGTYKTLRGSLISSIRRRIGFVFQDYRLLDNLTVAENISLPLYIQKNFSKRRVRRLVSKIATDCGIYHLLDQKVIHLSGGEKQLVAMARAAIVSPQIILADEPTANLDPETAERILTLLGFFQSRGTTIIVATHDISLIRSYKGKVFLIKDRKMTQVQ